MSDSNIAEDLEVESVANLLIDEFYFLVTRKNSSALVFKRKSKIILKDAWEQFIARADKEEEFEVFFRKEILSVNKFSHLLSLYALMSRVALRFKWRKTEDVSQIIDFLKIEDPLVAEYEKIFFKEKKPSKNTAYKLGCEYSGDFNTKYDFCEDRFTLEVTLLFSAKKRKITAADSATALNSVYRLNKDLFELLHNKTLPKFFKRNKLPKIGVKEWGRLSSGCKESISWNITLHSLLDFELRSVIKKSPLDLEGSFHSKVVDSHRFLHSVIHNSSLVTGDRLNLGEEDDFKAGIVLKHPCLKDFENVLLTYFINVGKKMSWRKWFFPLRNLQPIFFKEVKRNASNEFFDKFCFLSGSQEVQKKIIKFSDHQFLDFWETFPLAAFNEWLGATEIKDIKTSKLLVEKSKSCGMKTEFYEKVPVKRGWWTQYNDYELTDFDINTFPLWVGDFKDNDSQLIALIRSNFAALSGLISKPEVCRILLERLSGTNEFGKAINLLKDIFGLNLHKTLRKFCFNEWKQFLVSCYSEGIKEGKDASDVFIWLYKLDSKFCKQILNRKISAKNAVALLRNIEFSPEAVHFLRSLRVKDSKKIIDVIIEQPRLTRGAIRFSTIISDSEFTKVFIKHPKQLLNHARKRLSPSKFFKLSLEHYAVGFAVYESVQYDSRLDLSKIASRAFRGKPTVILAAKTAILLSPMDFKFLKFLAFRRSKQGRQSNGSHFDDLYKEWKIPKKSGGDREIASPNKNLKRLQRRLMESLGCFCDTHEAAHGFVSGKGILSNATEHVGKKIVANVDIANFFPNTSRKMVFQSLMRESDLPADICGFISEICLRNGGLPAGAPTSPLIGNIVLKRFDDVMSKSLKSANVNYTRYADDITISSDNDVSGYIGFAEKLLKQSGYSLNKKKTNFFRQGRRQMVTGLSVNSKVNVPRRIRRNLRAAIHSRSKGKETTWMGRSVDDQVLEGLCAFVKSINPKEGRRHKKNLKKALK